ncbi:MAG: hypothetical protein WCY28_00360 [Candidatus Shapirobacteria bacterium]
MIQIPVLGKEDIPKVIEAFKGGNYPIIPDFIDVTREYIDPQEIMEEFSCGVQVERKAYIIECTIKNEGFNPRKILFEQRFSQGPCWISGYVDYLPKRKISLFNRRYIEKPIDLATCRTTKGLIDNYLQINNTKGNLYGIGLIGDEFIRLKQLLVFEIVHFNDYRSTKNLITDFIKINFTPIKIPFI